MTLESAPQTLLPGVDRSWWTWHGAHGGLMAALLLRHARRRVGDLPPRSWHASFLEPVTADRLGVSTEVLRHSWSSATTRSALAQDTSTAITASGMFGRAVGEREYQPSSAPPVPDHDACPDAFDAGLVPIEEHLEIRPASAARPLGGGSEAQLTAWIRLRDLRLEPAEAALVLLDSMPPALYAVLDEPIPIPSAEISVRFTGRQAAAEPDGWCLIQVRTERADQDWTLESGSLWSPRGELLAVSLQTRRIVVPPGMRLPALLATGEEQAA